MSMLEQRIADLGYELPTLPPYEGAFAPGVVVGDVLFLSAQTWTEGGKPKLVGRVGDDVSVEDASEMARRAVLNALAAAKTMVGSLERVAGVARLAGFVRSAPGYERQSLVLNAGSELLVQIFGPSGRHARTSVGVGELTGGATVLIELTLALRPEERG